MVWYELYVFMRACACVLVFMFVHVCVCRYVRMHAYINYIKFIIIIFKKTVGMCAIVRACASVRESFSSMPMHRRERALANFLIYSKTRIV